MTTNSSNTRKLTESAIMMALAVVLSLFAVFKLPNGGSVTIGSMLPILFIAFKYSGRWGILTALVYSCLQMLLGFYPPPVQDFTSFLLVILLDYVIAFGVLGLGGIIFRAIKKPANVPTRMAIAGVICCAARFLCHFLSGIIIWDVYAPEGQPVWLYSLTYNGSYMLAEAVITTVLIYLVGGVVWKYILNPAKK